MERLFDLDPQLLADTVIAAIAVFVLFTLLSYLLFNPVRKVLQDRQERIREEKETTQKEKDAATDYKAKYEAKLKNIENEAQDILAEARKKALKNEAKIIADAKDEAARIVARASMEIELEKKRARDEMKQDVISVAAMMAQKVVSASVDLDAQNTLLEDTLKEMGDQTWLS